MASPLATGSRQPGWRAIAPRALLLATLAAAPAGAHEPVFGVGPETIYRGGVGLELAFELDELGEEGHDRTLTTELLYGLTPDFSLTLELPTLLHRRRASGSGSGLGDVLLRGKYRFWNRNRLGSSDRAAWLLGVRFPTGAHHRRADPGSGGFDLLTGVSVAHESRRWYGFGTLRTVLRTQHQGLDRGERLLFDLAGGVRPWLTEYTEPDLVMLLEFNGEWASRDRRSGHRLRDSGGWLGWLGPTALLSYRSWMLKIGVQVPVASHLGGGQQAPDLRALTSLEYHF